MEKDIRRVKEDLKNEKPNNDEILEDEIVNSFELDIRTYEFLNQWRLR